MRLGVFRVEAQDVVPLGFGPLFAATRERFGEDNLEAPGETEIRTTNVAVNED